jgi:hypothetical protein
MSDSKASSKMKNADIVNVDLKKSTTDNSEPPAGETSKASSKTNSKPKSNMKTEEERRASSLEILKQVKALDLSVTHPPIRELLKLLKRHNETGERIAVNIPFPDLNRRIKGVLAPGAREDSYIVLKHEKF